MSYFAGHGFQPKFVEEWALAHSKSFCYNLGRQQLPPASSYASPPSEVSTLTWEAVSMPLTLAIPLLVSTL